MHCRGADDHVGWGMRMRTLSSRAGTSPRTRSLKNPKKFASTQGSVVPIFAYFFLSFIFSFVRASVFTYGALPLRQVGSVWLVGYPDGRDCHSLSSQPCYAWKQQKAHQQEWKCTPTAGDRREPYWIQNWIWISSGEATWIARTTDRTFTAWSRHDEKSFNEFFLFGSLFNMQSVNPPTARTACYLSGLGPVRVCLVRLSVCLSALSLYFPSSVCLSVCLPGVYQIVYWFVVCPSVCSFACLSVCPSVHLSIYPLVKVSSTLAAYQIGFCQGGGC